MEVPLLHPAYCPPLRLRVRTAGDRRQMIWLTVPLNDAEALSPVSAGWLASQTVPTYLDTEGYLFAHRFMDLPDFRAHEKPVGGCR
jgi:hypothetical protein